MTAAAIIPYRAFSAGCVVAIVDGPLVLADETIIIGHLARAEGTRVVRVIDDAAIASAVARVVALVEEHRPRVVNVEALDGDSVEAQRGRFVGAALMQALPFAVMVPGAKGELADRLARLLTNEGESNDGSEQGEEVGAEDRLDRRLPQDAGSSPEDASDTTPKGRHASSGGDLGHRVPDGGRWEAREEAAPGEDAQGAGVGGGRADRGGEVAEAPPGEREGSGGVEAEGRAHEPEQARRVAGIDPGSRHVAVTVLEGAAAPLRYIASLTLNIGRDVPLRAPKVIKRKDGGGTFTKTTRHEVTDADRDAMLLKVAEFIAAHDVDEAAVETAKFAHTGAGALLLRSNRYGGVIEGALVAAGLPVRSVTSREWRDKARKMAGERSERDGVQEVREREARAAIVQSAVVQLVEGEGGDAVRHPDEGRDRDRGGDATERRVGDAGTGAPTRHHQGDGGRVAWSAAVRALVAGLPIAAPDAREHIIDAAGAAAWAAIPDEPKPSPIPKGKRPRSTSPSKRRQDAARAASGCPGAPTCRPPEPGKRGSRWVHGDGCAAGVASSAKRAQGMKGNMNARKGASE